MSKILFATAALLVLALQPEQAASAAEATVKAAAPTDEVIYESPTAAFGHRLEISSGTDGGGDVACIIDYAGVTMLNLNKPPEMTGMPMLRFSYYGSERPRVLSPETGQTETIQTFVPTIPRLIFKRWVVRIDDFGCRAAVIIEQLPALLLPNPEGQS